MSTLFPIRSNDPVVSVISKKMPKLEEFIGNSDFVGAKTLLQFQLASIDDSSFADIDSNAIATVEMKGKLLEWLAWCSFHNSEYQGSLETYDKLLVLHEEGYKHELLHEDMINLFRATCMYFLNDYDKAEQAAMRCMDCATSYMVSFSFFAHLVSEPFPVSRRFSYCTNLAIYFRVCRSR